MLILKVTEVNTEHKKWPKISKNRIKSPFFARRAKKALAGGRIPPQELEVSRRSGLYLLVFIKIQIYIDKISYLTLYASQKVWTKSSLY